MEMFTLLIIIGIAIAGYSFVARNTALAQKQSEYDRQAKEVSERNQNRYTSHIEAEKEEFENQKAEAIAEREKAILETEERIEELNDLLPQLKEDLEIAISLASIGEELEHDEVDDDKYDYFIRERKNIIELKTDIENIEHDLDGLPKNILIIEKEIAKIKEVEFEDG